MIKALTAIALLLALGAVALAKQLRSNEQASR